MTEKIVVTNVYGSGNNKAGELNQWLRNMDVDVAIISETKALRDNLRNIGNLYTDDPFDTSILLMNGLKADEWQSVKLTDHIHRDEAPMLWSERRYVRVRVNKRVYYSIHANAAIQKDGRWLDNKGANAWREAMNGKLKDRVKGDIRDGYAVRIGGDFNFPMSNAPGSPKDFFNDLGLNYMDDGAVMWMAWDPRYSTVSNKFLLGTAPGADAHKSIRLNLEPKEVPKGGGGSGGSGGGGSGDPGGGTGGGGTPVEEPRAIVSNRTFVVSNLESGRTNSQVKSDLNWIVENFKPEIWAVQEAGGYLDLLRTLEGFKVVLPENIQDAADRQNPILVRDLQYRVVGARNYGPTTVAHLIDRDTKDSVYVSNINIENPSTEKNKVKNFAVTVKEKGEGPNISLWAGSFGDPKDYPKAEFSEAGLIGIFDELPTNIDDRTRSVVGSYKPDLKIKAERVIRAPKQDSDHRFVKAVYNVAHDRGGAGEDPTGNGPGGGGGSYEDKPVKGDEEEEPTPKPLPSQKDEGPQINHSECCAGKSA